MSLTEVYCLVNRARGLEVRSGYLALPCNIRLDDKNINGCFGYFLWGKNGSFCYLSPPPIKVNLVDINLHFCAVKNFDLSSRTKV